MEVTDSSVPSQGQPPLATVAAWSTKCLEAFHSSLDRAALVHPREFSLVENQAARFSLWVANSVVFAKGRASMDYRLREAPDVQDVVIGLLEALSHRVQRCTDLLPEKTGALGPLPSIGDTFTQELDGVSANLKLLFRFSNTVRKASRAVHNRKVEEGFRILDDQGNDIEGHLRQVFASYVRDRYPGASERILERLVTTMLLRRKRILYRKKRHGTVTQPRQHSQWPLEPRRPEFAPAAANPQGNNAMRAPVTVDVEPNLTEPNPTPESVVRTATTLSPENFHKASTPSVMSVAKTVPLSEHEEIVFPPAPFGNLLHKYNRWRWDGDGRRDQVNRAMAGFGFRPTTDIYANWRTYAVEFHQEYGRWIWQQCRDIAERFPCPFCFCTLPAEDMMYEEKWRSHVLSDLDPYVCLFESCEVEHELYSHSHSWLEHMRGHAVRWRCSSKSHAVEFVATTKDDYLLHMESCHQGKFSTPQLTVLAQRNARLIGPLFESCPLCGVLPDLDAGPMEDHVVGHLRKLAIYSLPNSYVDLDELNEPPDFVRYQDQEPSDFWDSEPRNRTDVEDDDDDHDDDNDMNVPVAEDAANDAVAPEPAEDAEDIPWDARQTTGSQLRELQWGFVPRLFEPQMDPGSRNPSIIGREIGGGLESQPDPDSEPDDQSTGRTGSDRPNRKTIRMDPDCALCRAPAVAECDCEAISLMADQSRAEMKIFSRIQNTICEWVRGNADAIMKTRFERQELRQFALQTLAESSRDAASASPYTLPAWINPNTQGDTSPYVHLTPDLICTRASIRTKQQTATGGKTRRRTESADEEPFLSEATYDGAQQNLSVAEVYPAVLDHLFSLPNLAVPDNDHPLMNISLHSIPSTDVDDVEGNDQRGGGPRQPDATLQGEDIYRPGSYESGQVEVKPLVAVPTYSYQGVTESKPTSRTDP